MKKFSKQLISLLLAVVLLLGLLPLHAFATSWELACFIVQTPDGRPIDGATLSVELKPYEAQDKWWVLSSDSIFPLGNGVYKFWTQGPGWYTYTITKDGYEDYIYETGLIDPDGSTVYEVTMSPKGSDYQAFDVYYYLANEIAVAEGRRFPWDYAAAGDAGDYGPSRDNTPLVTIKVDLNKLMTMPTVQYKYNSDGTFYFIPKKTDQDVDAVKAFWADVWKCVDEESKQAFAVTGLDQEFAGYCLKKEGNAFHCDGILIEDPPVYVIEMYHNGNYFAGEVVDEQTPGKDIYGVLAFCEDYLNQTVTWKEDGEGRPALLIGADGTEYYEGTYIENNYVYSVKLEVRKSGTEKKTHISGLSYYKVNGMYYLAQFDLKVEEMGQVHSVVTYADGVDDEEVFHDHHYGANYGANVPAYTGIYTREDYYFRGWTRKGGDGAILSDEQVQELKVYNDMTFLAVWGAHPKYTGTVELVLNGTYDAFSHTATGERISLETIRGAGAKLYVKKDQKYTELTPVAGQVGVYSASLANGTYYFFYSTDGGVTMNSTGNQQLTINSEDRVHYLFYNTVQYDLNGGTGGPDPLLEYHRSGYSVQVSDVQLTKEGCVFLGWKVQDDQSGKLYQSGEQLTDDIAKPYVLIAQWEQSLVFHANNPEFEGAADIFRIYYPNTPENEDKEYKLTAEGTIEGFYDIPVFPTTQAHNNYIFKGWYLDKGTDTRPITFDDLKDANDGATNFGGVTDVYAHWVLVGEVDKNAADNKRYDEEKYQGFDLLGVQFRRSKVESMEEDTYHGQVGAGLRFVAVLSQRVYDEIEALSDKNPIVPRETGAEATMEYGFAVATKSATDKRALNNAGYKLKYRGKNVNGENTSTAYSYAQNMVCSGPTIVDHYKDESYRLYTAVVTFESESAQALKDSPFVARAYLRYHDANGLYRTHTNIYEGTEVYGGVSISYNQVRSMFLPTATQE